MPTWESKRGGDASISPLTERDLFGNCAVLGVLQLHLQHFPVFKRTIILEPSPRNVVINTPYVQPSFHVAAWGQRPNDVE
jgi:hypothetical protein